MIERRPQATGIKHHSPSAGLLRLALVAAVALVLLPGVSALPAIAQKTPADKVIPVPSEDVAMNAAIAKARETLPEFWSAHATPQAGVTNFSLKVRIVDKNGFEHFWLNNIERNGDKLTGTINNEPNIVKSVKLGQRYTFSEYDISDWLFMRGGKMVGNETMRPLLDRMPAADAARYRAMLEKP